MLAQKVEHGFGRRLLSLGAELGQRQAFVGGTRAGRNHHLVPGHRALRGAPAAIVGEMLRYHAFARRRIAKPLLQPRVAAVMGPRRKQCTQVGAARRIRVDIGGGVEAARACCLDQLEGARKQRPVLATECLEMRDLQRHAALVADTDRLVDGVEQRVGFAAHVREILPATARHRSAQRDQLIGRRIRARRIHQPGRDAKRAGADCLAEQVHHPREFARVGRAVLCAHGGVADRAVADKMHDVDCELRAVEHVEVVFETAPAHLQRRAE